MKMLHVTVKKAFRDGRTGLERKPGDTMTISDERYREIKRSGDYVDATRKPAEKIKAKGENK